MNSMDVTVAKVYLVEGNPLLNKVLHYLHDEAQVKGVSVFRAISGFGESGVHTTAIMDLSFSLPLVVEFFDEPQKMETVVNQLAAWIKPHHILLFSGRTNS